MNIGLREQSVLSNSADDLTALVEHLPLQLNRFDQDYTDGDDGKIAKKKSFSFFDKKSFI